MLRNSITLYVPMGRGGIFIYCNISYYGIRNGAYRLCSYKR